jgi:nucleoside-diphosphate-sugar epimerase
MTRVLAVTGASGFCGAVVARSAAMAGWEVRCLGRRPGPVGHHIPWDAARDVPDLGGTDAVVHLAAAVGDPPSGRAAERAFRAVNVDGTARLLDALDGRPLVHVSSASVYAPGGRAVTEQHPIGRQRTAYGRTKAAGEALALAAGAVVLRPRAVYGPGDPHLLPRLRAAVRGGTLVVPGPDTLLSLTAVENLADACLAALGGRCAATGRHEHKRPHLTPAWPPGPYNIADAHPYPRDAVLRQVLGDIRLLHIPIPLANAAAAAAALISRAGFIHPRLTRYAVDQLAHGVVLDTTRARRQGWSPTHDLQDFLRTEPVRDQV